jgi:FMN phosphatase YigB (HAD superfamily)
MLRRCALLLSALALAGAAPEESVHAGDSVEHDVAGALAIGMRAVLVDRDGTAGRAGRVPAGVRVTRTLDLAPYSGP